MRQIAKKTKKFLEKNSILLNWQELNKLDFNEILNTMAMIAPISGEEKQKLLEAENFKTREQFFNEVVLNYLDWANEQAENGNIREIVIDG